MYCLSFVLLSANVGISDLLLPLHTGHLYLLFSIGCYRTRVQAGGLGNATTASELADRIPTVQSIRQVKGAAATFSTAETL